MKTTLHDVSVEEGNNHRVFESLVISLHEIGSRKRKGSKTRNKIKRRKRCWWRLRSRRRAFEEVSCPGFITRNTWRTTTMKKRRSIFKHNRVFLMITLKNRKGGWNDYCFWLLSLILLFFIMNLKINDLLLFEQPVTHFLLPAVSWSKMRMKKREASSLIESILLILLMIMMMLMMILVSSRLNSWTGCGIRMKVVIKFTSSWLGFANLVLQREREDSCFPFWFVFLERSQREWHIYKKKR